MESPLRFMSIRQVAQTGLISEHCLRLMEKQGKLPGVYSGKKKLVNVQQLMAQLDSESRSQKGAAFDS